MGAGGEIAPRVGERTRLRLGASLQRREYDGKRFDDMTLAFYAGPRVVLSTWDLNVLGTGFRRWYGGKRFNEGVGARLEATHYLDSRTALSFGVSAQEVRYPRSPPQTGPSFAAFGGAVRTLTAASSVTVRLGLGRQASRSESFANWSGQVGVGYYRDLPGGFSIYLEPSLSYSRYDEADPLFGERRQDLGQEMQVALLNRRVVLKRFTPRISYTFDRRNSTIDLYDFSETGWKSASPASFEAPCTLIACHARLQDQSKLRSVIYLTALINSPGNPTDLDPVHAPLNARSFLPPHRSPDYSEAYQHHGPCCRLRRCAEC